MYMDYVTTFCHQKKYKDLLTMYSMSFLYQEKTSSIMSSRITHISNAWLNTQEIFMEECPYWKAAGDIISSQPILNHDSGLIPHCVLYRTGQLRICM